MAMDDLAAQVTSRLMRHFIEIEASGRHVHLTAEAAQTLFGHPLTPKKPLSQPGQYACAERVTLIGSKGRLENVAVLGPARKECQVELSMTDCVTLGVAAPVRLSGDIDGTPGITLQAGENTVRLARGVIVAKRHIHMTPEDAALQNISGSTTVRLRCFTGRPLVFDDVAVRISPEFATRVHLDYDEANACGFRQGDLGMIVP